LKRLFDANFLRDRAKGVAEGFNGFLGGKLHPTAPHSRTGMRLEDSCDEFPGRRGSQSMNPGVQSDDSSACPGPLESE
jgi:hypothetical protein